MSTSLMMGSRTEIFAGANVFLSRNLVPPELYDSLHDALRLNGAQVFLCCDPSRNSPNDYHVISSDHDKFPNLKSQNCNILGPHCILSCAKERRSLPSQGYTCCLAMDGVKILASGFENHERTRIAQRVSAMGGVFCSRTSHDVSFVIARNVLAAKYKWATNVLKKPVVGIDWLNQCWLEHRLVPHDPCRIPPFSGLTVCVTRFGLDERKEIKKLIVENGGRYSDDLTRKCTHLVSDAPEGDKYSVARIWGHIRIVTRRWVDLSIARRTCLEEENYPVHGHPTQVTCNSGKTQLKEEHSQEWNSTSPSQSIGPTLPDATTVINASSVAHELPASNEVKSDAQVAQDSEDEDDDLYLSNCRIFLLGFDAKETRRLVSMIRSGGGTRHMLVNEKLTHIIIGTPSESEKKEVRRLASCGVIHVVRQAWLEDCDAAKKELPVSQRHSASEFLFKIESFCASKTRSINSADTDWKSNAVNNVRVGQNASKKADGSAFSVVRPRGFTEVNIQDSSNTKAKSKVDGSLLVNRHEVMSSVKFNGTSIDVFKRQLFCFAHSFPEERRADIIEWVTTGGGLLVDDYESAHFVIECHGVTRKLACSPNYTVVSAHWIRSCLLEGSMQDVSSHILYSPLQCQVPLPGFEGLRFCISQYETSERQLLRNLCFTLGSECKEKLTRKTTHLLCKFTSGPKYEKASEWGMQSVTADWIFECVRQDKLVSMDPYRPKAATASDREAGACLSSQYPTQASKLYSDQPSQMLTMPSKPLTDSKSFDTLTNLRKHRIVECDASIEEPESLWIFSKKSKIAENNGVNTVPPSSETMDIANGSVTVVPDVAEAIEDLLAQSSKFQGLKLSTENGCSNTTFSPGGFQNSAYPSLMPRISNNWTNMSVQKSSICGPALVNGTVKSLYDFSETQTDSQVVSYEEDVSGRQKIIDRVRSQSSMLTPDKR